MSGLETITHGSCWSIHFRDPEGNRIEFFVDSAQYVPQPVVETMDLGLSDAELLRETDEQYGAQPIFRPMREWSEETAREIAAKSREPLPQETG